MEFWRLFQIAWAPDGEGAGGSDGDGGSGDGGAGGGQPDWLPDNLPDQFKADDPKGTIGKILTAYDGARKSLGERGAVPDEVSGYNLDTTPEIERVLGGKDDPAMPIFLEAAREAGITDKQLPAFTQKFVGDLIEAGLVNSVDPLEEARKVLGDKASGSDEEILNAGFQRYDEVAGVIDNMVGQKVFSEAEGEALKGLADTADGLLAFEKMRALTREHGLQTGEAGQHVGTMTRADLAKRNADPRNDPGNPKFDKAFAAETTRLYQEFDWSAAA